MGKQIAKILRKWKEEAKVDRVIQFKFDRNGILHIYTSQPGRLIGLHGVLVYKYIDIFKANIPRFKTVEFTETDYYSI